MPEMPLGDLLTSIKDEVPLHDDEVYVTVGILSYGKGLFGRPRVRGSETSYKSYFRLKRGQFVYSKLFAWEGALAVVEDDFDGRFVSPEFPTFDINRALADPAFVRLLCGWEPIWQRLRAGETGMGGRRKRVHPDKLLATLVPVPALESQRRIVDLLDVVDSACAAATTRAEAAHRTLTAFSESLIDWDRDLRALGEVARITSRLVDPTTEPFSGLPHIGIERMESGTGRLIGVVTAAEDGVTSGKYLFESTDLVYSKIRPGLRKAVRPGFQGLCSADAYPLSCTDVVLVSYLQAVLLSDEFTRLSVAKSGRTKMPKINRTELFSIKVPIPDLESQRAVVDLWDPLREFRDAALTEVEALQGLREAVRDSLLSGDHEIPDSYDELLSA